MRATEGRLQACVRWPRFRYYLLILISSDGTFGKERHGSCISIWIVVTLFLAFETWLHKRYPLCRIAHMLQSPYQRTYRLACSFACCKCGCDRLSYLWLNIQLSSQTLATFMPRKPWKHLQRSVLTTLYTHTGRILSNEITMLHMLEGWTRNWNAKFELILHSHNIITLAKQCACAMLQSP